MKIHYPAYYRDFICTGGACEDTCCGGWQIGIDQESYHKYKNVQGAFGKRLQRGIDHRLRVFRLSGRQCAFLNDAGFCDIYKEMGRGGLCRTCRTYPRHMEDYGDLQEIMLSLSCPEAARLILGDKENGRFLNKEHPKKAEPLENREFLALLTDIRQTVICILKNRSMGWEERLAMVLAFAHDVQRRLPGAEQGVLYKKSIPESVWQEIGALSRRYLAPNAVSRFSSRLSPYRNRGREQLMRTAAFVREAWELEPVVAGWRRRQEKVCRELYHDIDMDAYIGSRKKFSARAAEYEMQWENLILYFINTLFLGAVYDGDILGKIKMTLFGYIIIRENCFAVSRMAGKLTEKMLISASYRYSREVENSNANLETLERHFGGRLFGLDSMMTVLLGDTGIYA